MLRSLDAILGFEAHGTHGRLGVVRDIRFDSRSWVIEHFLLVSTGFLSSDLLLGVDSVLRIDTHAKRIFFGFAMDDADARPPATEEESQRLHSGAPHLLRTHELCGYLISGQGSQTGHIDDYIFDDQNWSIRYLVIESGAWGQPTWLVAPPADVRLDWRARRGTIGGHRLVHRRLA